MTKVESKVYLDLVRNGKSFVGDISRRTHLNRTNLYDVLQSLKHKGFIFTSKNVKKVFIANPPEILIKKYEENEEKIKEIVKELKKGSKTIDNLTGVKIFEGKESFDEILTIILKEKTPLYFYGASLKSMESFGNKQVNRLHQERIKNKIHMKVLAYKYPKEELDRINNLSFSEGKNISEKYFSEENATMFIIAGDKVFIGTQTEPVYIILIQNKQVANNYISFFNMLWDFSV